MENRIYITVGLAALLLLNIINIEASSASTTDLAATNVVVDFDATSLDSNLRAGDSGVMNLVIKNTGGQRADNVQIYLPSSTPVQLDKRFYVGELEAGDSKTFPVIVRISSDARSGLNAIQVQISYDGFDDQGDADDNKVVTFEIPFRIYGNPLFQLTPSKTTYYKDNMDELDLIGVAKDSIKDLETTLSSSCVTVIGPSRQYIGSINYGQIFNISYQIKPSTAGACQTSLQLSYTDQSGNRGQDNITMGLNVEDAGVNFKVINVSYDSTGPGETTKVKIAVENVGGASADDTTISLALTSPFAPADSQEKYIGKVSGGETIDTEFNIAVGWDAVTPQTYNIPMTITYKVGGTSYSIEKDIGIDVSGQIILEVLSVSSRSGSVSIDVANIGTTTANSVKATLIVGGGGSATTDASASAAGFRRNATQGGGGFAGNRSGLGGNAGNFTQSAQSGQSYISYKSDIKPSKQTTFTFTTSATGPAILNIEYTGLNNERVTQTERITLSGSSSLSGTSGLSSSRNSGGGISITTLALYALVILVVAFVGYKLYKRRKKKAMEAAVKAKTSEATAKKEYK